MCGISGIVGKKSEQYSNAMHAMAQALHHRGPDGSAVYFFENCALGHNRLSIVDLATGEQPMITPDKNRGIVFNGEIYGYKEIKEALQKEFHFKTASDTEVILALYQKYGEKLPEHLPGMFAFAIWDDEKQKLFCARDRFGEKPFYYAWGEGGEFIFASEIKAILATGLVKPVIDRGSLVHYLRHLYVEPGKSIYKNIFVLPPAHYLIAHNGDVVVGRYWQLPVVDEKIGVDEAVDKFKILLKQAVERQLVADVPVGAFLSGGLDSTTIVSLASGLKQGISTYSFGFGDSINELPFAREAAAKYKTTHLELQAGAFDLAELFVEMQNIYDEPFADSSNIPTYLIAKLAREHTKVVLTGDGGDELFGGYTGWYKPIYYMAHGRPFRLSAIVADLFNAIVKNSIEAKRDLYYRFIGWMGKIRGIDPIEFHIAQNTYFSDGELRDLLGGAVDAVGKTGKKTSLDDVMRHDATHYMPGDILTKIDRASMASGLELRSPFLDIEFASFCLSLPYRLKIDGKEDKIILRRAFAALWTESIRKRSKQGFGAPVTEWLRQSSFVELKKKFLTDPGARIFQIINFDQCQKIAKKNNYQTWIILGLAVWLEKHPYDLAK